MVAALAHTYTILRTHMLSLKCFCYCCYCYLINIAGENDRMMLHAYKLRYAVQHYSLHSGFKGNQISCVLNRRIPRMEVAKKRNRPESSSSSGSGSSSSSSNNDGVFSSTSSGDVTIIGGSSINHDGVDSSGGGIGRGDGCNVINSSSNEIGILVDAMASDPFIFKDGVLALE
jgi:hypothetical protein